MKRWKGNVILHSSTCWRPGPLALPSCLEHCLIVQRAELDHSFSRETLMAEAGPSTPSPRPASPAATPPSSSPSPQRAARIHFPVDQPRSQVRDSSSFGSFQSLGLGPPPNLRKAGNQGGSISFQQDDKRRRVKSVDASGTFEQSRSRDGYAGTSSKRTGSFSRKGEPKELLSKAVSNALLEPFSEEYDLCELPSCNQVALLISMLLAREGTSILVFT